MNRREFTNVLSAAAAAGFPVHREASAQEAASLYDLPRKGNVSLLHFTDCHAQLLPIYFREPNVNIGVAGMRGQVPHLVGEYLLKHADLKPGSLDAHAHTHIDFERLARQFGKVGGFAHITTLVKRLRASRPGALLLDGGDTWQGSGTAMWTGAQDMVDVCLKLGVNVMTAHWEFTYGEKRVKELLAQMEKAGVDFVAHNVKTRDFEDPVFKPFVIKEINGARVAVIGQAFPYTPIANPHWLVPDWTFGIQEAALQKQVDAARGQGVHAVVLLSHNGMDVDLKLASRVTGIDVILGGHTHDGVPKPTLVANPGGKTLVTNGGSNGKFLGVLDLDIDTSGKGSLRTFHYRLLPVFANLLPADPEMQALIDKTRAPFAARLAEPLAVTEGTLYRRGNFNGTFDQVMCDALLNVRGGEIAFSPGFRWGTSLLPGQTITREHVLDQTAITYPWTTLADIKGDMIKTILEDVADNIFNPDPYYQQGGDMARVGGMSYTIDPLKPQGQRITDMRLANGQLLDANKSYKVAGWAPVQEASKNAGPPAWEVLEQHLKAVKTLKPIALNQPRVLGMDGNPGMV
jgi:S-sulfosulfanyl-L-cysteine sulfohydrolase